MCRFLPLLTLSTFLLTACGWGWEGPSPRGDDSGSSSSSGSSGSSSGSSSSSSSGSSTSSGGESACLPGEDSGDEFELPELVESPMPGDGGDMQAEMMAALSLVDYEDVTHAAAQDGSWCDPYTWHNQQIPGNGARVVIPEDRVVSYGAISNARLKTLRVDGELRFSITASTRLVLDTLVVDPRGSLVIGSEETPVNELARAEIVIAENGDIDAGWDSLLLSRGILSLGRVIIHGHPKTAHLPVAVNPTAGETSIALQRQPESWREGDTVLVVGTRYSGWKWNNAAGAVTYHGTQDEVRKIVAINGNMLTLDRPLDFDHLSPRADLKTRVANFTRNVAILSESGASLPAHQRGHLMFMHGRDVDVRFTELTELGRTNKSIPSIEARDLTETQADSNVRGRYSFHLHHTSSEDPRNPVTAVGNAAFRSPGWGFVQHDSHANFYSNVTYDTFGAGFVAESGNETGAWVDNLAVKAEGNEEFNPKNGNDFPNFDIAKTGDGFWFQGRLIRSVANVAASVNHGFVYLHRGEEMLDFPADRFMLPEALGYGREVHADEVPIRNFHGNEAFASTVGLFVVKADPIQGHDVYTELTNFTAWEVIGGAAIEYTAHYMLGGFDLTGSTPERFRQPEFGIQLGTNTTDVVVRSPSINAFPEGIRMKRRQTDPANEGLSQYVVIGASYTGVTNPITNYDPDLDLVLEFSDLVPGRFAIELDNNMQFEFLRTDQGVQYSGGKIDSIGDNPLPGGSDELGVSVPDMIALLEREGYYRTGSGDAYAVVEQYFSDRATADVHKYGFKTYLGPEVNQAILSPSSRWSGAVYRGSINLQSAPPTAADDSAQTGAGEAVTINLIWNDTDSDGDLLSVDGIIQPRYGNVFDNGDGTVSYQPDIGFTGTDRFKYWATDSQGNFAPAWVEVLVE